MDMMQWLRRQIRREMPTLSTRHGFVLISSYLVVAVLLLLQTAYFSRIANDQQLTMRHGDVLKALHYADAGLDQAIVQLANNSGYAGTGGNVTLGSGTYNVTVTTHPADATLRVVTSIGSYPNTDPNARTNRVQALVRVAPQYFNYGLFGDKWIKLTGTIAIPGGYNSSKGELPQAPYLKAPADIGTNGTGVGDVKITGSLTAPYSYAWCGPGSTPPPNYCVNINGSANYLGPAVMTQPNPLPTVTAPTAPYPVVNLSISGGTYTFSRTHPLVFQPVGAPAGHYAVVVKDLSVSGGAVVVVTSDITELDVYVTGDLSLSGSAKVGDLTTYKATQLIVYLPNDEDVSVSGGATLVGAIFAKKSRVSMTGSATVYGAVAAKEIEGNGSYVFYFDGGLKSLAAGQTGPATLVVWERK